MRTVSRNTGETVARAKRTSSERAAARRRYRAAEQAQLDAEEVGALEEPARRAQPQGVNVGAVRMGIVAAFRQSFRPLNVREDLVALPGLIRHRALWIPVLAAVASAAVVVGTGGQNPIVAVLFAYFVQPPAIGAVFLAGFLAQRASWLLGAIVGVVSAVAYIVVLGAVPGALTTDTPGAASFQNVAISSILLSPVMGAFFASAAAWYRRFLTLSNPNRGRRAAQAPKRSGDGRTRAAAPKASARR